MPLLFATCKLLDIKKAIELPHRFVPRNDRKGCHSRLLGNDIVEKQQLNTILIRESVNWIIGEFIFFLVFSLLTTN